MSWRVSKPWKHQHTSGGGGSSTPPPPPPTEGTDNPPVPLMDNWIIENGWKGLLIDPQSTLTNEAYTAIPRLYMRGGMYWVYPGNVLIDEAIHVEQRMSYHSNCSVARHVRKAQAAVVLKVNGTLPRHDELKIVINNFDSATTYSFSQVHSDGSYNYYFYVSPEIDFPHKLEMANTKLIRFNIGTASTEYTKTGTIFYGYKGMPNDIYRKLKEMFVRHPYQGQFDNAAYVQGCHLTNFGNVVYGGLKWFRPTKTNPTPSPAHTDSFVPVAPVKPLNGVITSSDVNLSGVRNWTILLIDNVVVPTDGDSLTRYKAKPRIYVGILKDRSDQNGNFIGAPRSTPLLGSESSDSYDIITYNVFGNRKTFDYSNVDFFDWNPYINMSNARSSISATLLDQLSKYDFRVFSIDDQVSDFVDLNNLGGNAFDIHVDHKHHRTGKSEEDYIYNLDRIPVIIRTIYPAADKNGNKDRYDVMIPGVLSTDPIPYVDVSAKYNRVSRRLEFRLFDSGNKSWTESSAQDKENYHLSDFRLYYIRIVDSNRRFYSAVLDSREISSRKLGTGEIVSAPVNLDYLVNQANPSNEINIQLFFTTPNYFNVEKKWRNGLYDVFHLLSFQCRTRLTIEG